MDPLCHTLVGACLGETGLARGLRHGRLTAIVAANLPDLDVLFHFAGEDATLLHRRGWTHGVLAMAVLPALWAGAVLLVDRLRCRRDPERRRALAPPLILLSYLALLTHPLLDWLNTYGVRLLMPFDGRWFHADGVFIVDPWMWLLPGAGALLARRAAGLVGPRECACWLVLGALGLFLVLGSGRAPLAAGVAWTLAFAPLILLAASGRLRWPAVRVARLGLAATLLYAAGLFVLQGVAERRFVAAAAERGLAPTGELMVGPLPMNPLDWDVVAGTPGAWQTARAGVLPEAGVRLGKAPQRLEDALAGTPAVRAAWNAPGLEGFRNWARFPFAEVEEREEGWTVWLLDARYVRSRQEGFGAAVVELDRELRVRSVR